MQSILGEDINRVEVFQDYVIIHLKDGYSIQLYSEHGFTGLQYKNEE